MANIIVGIIKGIDEDTVKALKARKLVGDVYGFEYTNHNRPGREIIERCIEVQDVDAFPVMEGTYVQFYVNKHLISM